MKSLWNEIEAAKFSDSDLLLRTYTSRLLGQEPSLVLHGGGNTSVKTKVTNLFGEVVDVLYVKGSGWDLATMEPQGFAPVRMDILHKLSRLEKLSDADMVREQKAGMIDPSAPGPSVEAILHAIIPFKYVDHTHADAVVALTNTPSGEKLVRELYGDRVLFVPYVMPGFILARKIYELTRDVNWDKLDGLVLLNHGVFSFANEARESYEKMISLINVAEGFLGQKNVFDQFAKSVAPAPSGQDAVNTSLKLAELRREVSKAFGGPLLARVDASDEAIGFSNLKNIQDLATRGTLTPDHVIHTKPKPLVYTGEASADVAHYTHQYKSYFERNKNSLGASLTILDTAPRWAVMPGQGTVAFGPTAKNLQILQDINRHTRRAIQWSENLGGWKPLPELELFEVEYWELEQAKIKKNAAKPPLQGKVALVTGAASGIGRACAESLQSQGAVVIAMDIDAKVTEVFKKGSYLPVVCDVTNAQAVHQAIIEGIRYFGGLDIVVSNAGMFPAGQHIADLPNEVWDKSLAVNLTSHERLMKFCVPYLKLGFDSTFIVIASKNVPAPGPGAAAYSVAKAGLTQLARVAALELAPFGIRVNVLHPDAVFDTGIWTPEILANRAKHYGMSVDDYKRKNLLKAEVTSKDVGNLVSTLAGPAFFKTTGVQISVDGGNDRVI